MSRILILLAVLSAAPVWAASVDPDASPSTHTREERAANIRAIFDTHDPDLLVRSIQLLVVETDPELKAGLMMAFYNAAYQSESEKAGAVRPALESWLQVNDDVTAGNLLTVMDAAANPSEAHLMLTREGLRLLAASGLPPGDELVEAIRRLVRSGRDDRIADLSLLVYGSARVSTPRMKQELRSYILSKTVRGTARGIALKTLYGWGDDSEEALAMYAELLDSELAPTLLAAIAESDGGSAKMSAVLLPAIMQGSELRLGKERLTAEDEAYLWNALRAGNKLAETSIDEWLSYLGRLAELSNHPEYSLGAIADLGHRASPLLPLLKGIDPTPLDQDAQDALQRAIVAVDRKEH